MVSGYAVTENIDFCNKTDGNDTTTVGRVGLTVCCSREYRIVLQNRR